MKRWQVPEKNLKIFFEKLGQWALLRNPDVFENFSRGGDCDLLVGNLEEASRTLVEELGPPVLIARRSYLRSFFYPWGHLDLTNHYYWRGIKLLDGPSMLADKKCSGSYPSLSSVDTSILKLLGSLLWGGFLKERYTPDILDSYRENTEHFSERLRLMLGKAAADTICSHIFKENWKGLVNEVGSIRKSVKKHYRRKSFVRYWMGQLRFTFAEIRLRIFDLLPVLVLKVNRHDREAMNAELPIVTKVTDQHCKVVEVTNIVRCLALPLILLANISFRARNGLLIIVRENDLKLNRFTKIFYVNYFLGEFSSRLGFREILDSYYAYYVSENRWNSFLMKGQISKKDLGMSR